MSRDRVERRCFDGEAGVAEEIPVVGTAEEAVQAPSDTARIELRPTAANVTNVMELPGVLNLKKSPETVIVTVSGDACDALLRAALTGGWSVVSVHRSVGAAR